VGHRTFYNSATWWTMLAVAIRVGTALRLGQEDQLEANSIQLQLRRRLWYCIALLDTHGSYDRGTPPMIRLVDLGLAPLLLNDDQLSQTILPEDSVSGFNEMSFFALMYLAMVCQQQILSMPNNAENGWTARLKLLSSFERDIEQAYFNVSKDAQPLERFAEQVAKGIIASLHLVLRRPPYKQNFTFIPSSDNFNVLEHSAKLLQQFMAMKSIDFAPWAWKSWVPWNALAIVLVELCSQSPSESNDAAYSIAVQSFNRYSSLIADTDMGMLWRPIAKLMHQVQKSRAMNHISEPASNLTNKLDSDIPMYFSASECPLATLDLNSDSNAENPNVFQNDEIMTTSGDAQNNWLTFTNSMYVGYPTDWEHDIF
jgi:hypothetical protein